MKHLFVTDMDGTLLNRSGQISPKSAEIISDLSRQGALITVATARTPGTVEPLMAHTFTIPPAIVMTGAAMWDRRTHSYIHPRYISPSDAEAILTRFLQFGVTPLSYTITPGAGIIHAYYHGHPSPREQKFIDERSRLNLKKIHIISSGPAARQFPIHPDTILILGLGNPDKIYPLAQALRLDANCAVSAYPDIFNHSLAYIEVFAPGVDKASAVLQLKRHLGADHLTVFGDNLNDLPMMAIADTAVAVANALPQVQAAATTIIPPNTADSVPLYIAKHFHPSDI